MENKTHTSTYKRNLRVLAIQKDLLDVPESLQHMSKRLGIYITTVGQFMAVLHKAKGCGRAKRYNAEGKMYYVYFKTPKDVPFDTGTCTWKPKEPEILWQPPTDDPTLNAMIGYTNFRPLNGRHIDERHASWTGASTPFSNIGSSLEMVA